MLGFPSWLFGVALPVVNCLSYICSSISSIVSYNKETYYPLRLPPIVIEVTYFNLLALLLNNSNTISSHSTLSEYVWRSLLSERGRLEQVGHRSSQEALLEYRRPLVDAGRTIRQAISRAHGPIGARPRTPSRRDPILHWPEEPSRLYHHSHRRMVTNVDVLRPG